MKKATLLTAEHLDRMATAIANEQKLAVRQIAQSVVDSIQRKLKPKNSGIWKMCKGRDGYLQSAEGALLLARVQVLLELNYEFTIASLSTEP